MKRQYPLEVDLQLFANELIDFPEDGEEDNPEDLELDDSDPELEADDIEEEETDDTPAATVKPSKVHAFDEEEPPIVDPKEEEKAPVVEAPKPPVQSPEENAKFAEQRRQKETEEAVKQTPEYKLAQTLAEANGVTVEQMLQRVEEAKLEADAKAAKVPVDFLKKQQAQDAENKQTRDQLVQLQFQLWETRVTQEAKAVQTEYPFLTDDDIEQAQDYMLTKLKNPDVSMEEVIRMVHGKKIDAGIKEAARQEALAEMSGRKNSPLPPQGGKPAPTHGLTAAEKQMAKNFNMSEADYAKYKT